MKSKYCRSDRWCKGVKERTYFHEAQVVELQSPQEALILGDLEIYCEPINIRLVMHRALTEVLCETSPRRKLLLDFLYHIYDQQPFLWLLYFDQQPFGRLACTLKCAQPLRHKPPTQPLLISTPL